MQVPPQVKVHGAAGSGEAAHSVCLQAEHSAWSHSYFEVKPRLLVCFSALFGLGCSLIVYQVASVFLLIPFLILLALGIFDIERSKLLLAALAVILGMGNAQMRLARADENDISRYSGEFVHIKGLLEESYVLKSGKGMRLVVLCTAIDCGTAPFCHGNPGSMHGRILLNVFGINSPPESRPQPADQVFFNAKIMGVSRDRNPGGRASKYILAQRHIFCQASLPLSRVRFKRPDSTVHNILDETVSMWRKLLVNEHQKNLGTENGNLIASMVLGDKAVEPGQEITDSFRASGLSHVLAASGFNLSVVAASIYFLARYLCNLWIANSVCFTGMIVFVLIAGPSPSVVRAFLMGSVLLLARCLSRSAHLPAVLLLSMLVVMIVDPATAADVGFQLSYFSTAGMIIGANQLSHIFNRTKGFVCPEWAKVILAGTLIAQACVLPLQLYYFKQFNPYCLLANVLVTPLIPAITIAGFASSFCFACEYLMNLAHPISEAADKLCYYPLELIRLVVSAIALLPNAQTLTRQPAVAEVLLYYSALLAFPIFQLKNMIKLWFVFYCILLLLLITSAL